jgi:hypothetical protein
MSRKHTHTADVRSPRRQITNAVHNEWCQPFAYTGCSIKAIYCVNTFAIQLKPVVERIFQHIVLPYCRARSPAAISCVHEEDLKKIMNVHIVLTMLAVRARKKEQYDP